MAISMSRIANAKQVIRQSSLTAANKATSAAIANVPKGHFAVYVGESEKKQIVIPILYLNNPSFQNLLSQAEEEFRFDHSMVVLLFHAEKDIFIGLASELGRS